VLVGNDPVWEENGLYKKSNDILNKILQKLDSRMQLYPARSLFESLNDDLTETQINNKRYNVTNAFIPEYAHTPYIPGTNLFAKGVADIRINVSTVGLSGVIDTPPCDENNEYCEMPIQNGGDLRAQWVEECISKTDKIIRYKKNWPFHFGNPNPSRNCQYWPESPTPAAGYREYQEPVPVLTAAEWLPGYQYTIPASSGTSITLVPIYETIQQNVEYLKFSSNHIEDIKFILKDDENSNTSGNYSFYDEGQFVDPALENGRDAILQATGTPYIFDTLEKIRVVNGGDYNNESILMLEEQYENTSSACILMANLLAENIQSLGYSNIASSNQDKNIPFFNNLVMKSCNEAGHIHQIGGWTGHSSWASAYSKTGLTQLLNNFNHQYAENQDSNIPSGYVNIAWIANPLSIPSDQEINQIKNWLNAGNKKIIITFGKNEQVINNVNYICEKLNIDSKPWYSVSESKFLRQTSGKIYEGNANPNGNIQKLDSNHISIAGCQNGYQWRGGNQSSRIQNPANISLQPMSYIGSDIEEDINTAIYCPIKPSLTKQVKKIIYYNEQIIEKYWETPVGWSISATGATAKFQVLPESGYRMFVEYVSEYANEKFKVMLSTNDVIGDPNFPNSKYPQSAYFYGTSLQIPNKASFNFKVPSGVNELEVKFAADELFNQIDNDGSLPKTVRILSISGCLLPIETAYSTISQQVIVGSGQLITPWYIPEQIVTIPDQFRPIKTDSAKYCVSTTQCSGKLIEDGPVIVAEEFENFSTFTNGQNRSRIVVISDSTIIQGKNPYYRSGTFSPNQEFIRSLYPDSPSVSNAGRNFEFVQKIVAPERGSPAKYFAVKGLDMLVDKFGLNGVAGNLSNYTDQENNFDPRTLSRPVDPISGEDIDDAIGYFGENIIPVYGVYPRFSGMIDGVVYTDAKINGGVPKLMQDKGKDYLDFDFYFANPSGYPGDLFGYSLDIYGDKLVVGTPFHAFDTERVLSWNDIKASGFLLKSAGQGGAGAAFYYERTGKGKNVISDVLPWEFKQKIKPDSINIGMDNASTNDIYAMMGTGVQLLDADFVLHNAIIGDQFGYDVAINSDFMTVGAPGHDFETVHEHIYSGSAAFIRKEFTYAFDIPLHKFYDMGSSGVRIDQYNNQSGVAVLNNGAVFTFEHRIQDWRTREKKWEFAEKLVAQGYNTRNQVELSGCENDFFGRSVSIDRARRGDGDYTMIAGSPNHNYPTSGTHLTGKLENAGAAYIYDAMLREQEPKIPSEENWIKAQIFGNNDPLNNLSIVVYQNKTGDQISYLVTGVVNTNKNGDIFLEASGFDPASKGFIAHRPYVEYVVGNSISGTPTNVSMPLFMVTDPVKNSGNMNLYIDGPDSSFVYNNMNLLLKAWNSGENSLNLNSIGTSGIYLNQSLTLFMESGIGLSQSDLNLRIRGK
jgi:hypothetical protein